MIQRTSGERSAYAAFFLRDMYNNPKSMQSRLMWNAIPTVHVDVESNQPNVFIINSDENEGMLPDSNGVGLNQVVTANGKPFSKKRFRFIISVSCFVNFRIRFQYCDSQL